jgi:TP901 family phage tail tape measure protein
MGRFTASANQGKAAAKGLGDEAKKSGNILEGMLGKAKALVAAFAIGAVVTTSFGSAMNFEEQLSSIKALTGASAAEMQQMQSLSLKMGAATKYNALEAAKGIEELLKAGLTPAQVKAGALEAGLNLATAGGLDLAKAAEIMSTALNAFRKDGMSAAQASNILAGTANASAASVEELQYGLAQVGAVAAGVGLSFKDTNVALGTFANYGLKGSDAGTSLKTFLGNLQPVTDKQTALFKKLGLVTAKGGNQFFTAAGKIKPLNEIAQVLQDSFKGLTDQQRSLALETMFGSDAIRAGNILFEAGSKAIDEFAASMEKVTALDVAKEKMNNAKGAVEQFKGAIDTLKISALLPTMPIIRKLALSAADFTDKVEAFRTGPEFQKFKDYLANIGWLVQYVFGNVFKENEGAIRNIGEVLSQAFTKGREALDWLVYTGVPKLVGLLGDVTDKALGLANGIIENWPNIAPIVYGIAAAVSVYGLNLLRLVAIQKSAFIIEALSKAWRVGAAMLLMYQSGASLATMAQFAFNMAMNANPVGVVITAIGLLVTAIVWLVYHWDMVKGAVVGAFTTITGWLQKIPDWALLLAGPIAPLLFLIKHFDKVKEAVGGALTAVKNFFGFGDKKSNSSTSLNVSTNVDGSHANGLGYVPFDGYIGRLHKGEAVLTAEENKAYRAGIGASVAAGTANPAGNVITRTVTDNSRKVGKLFENLVIHQQPGEDAEKLANRVMDKLYDAIQEAAEIAEMAIWRYYCSIKISNYGRQFFEVTQVTSN